MRAFSFFLLICLAPFAALADDAPTAAKILSGDTMILKDGRTVRLEAIKAPTDQAVATLQSLTAQHPLMLEHDSIDRYGRTVAQIYALQDDGAKIWLQGEMLRAGMAFVYPPVGNEPRLDEMLKLESDARVAKRGIWNDDEYADISADEARKRIGHFAFVSGTVTKAERVKNKVYLNFGDDWRNDFTVTIAAKDLRGFRKAGIDPLAYQGKTIRVRGWVKRDFGPMVTVTTPAQISVQEPK